jgi:hypothetical protein
MDTLLGTYQGLLSQALTVGALLGIAGGIVLFTVDDASDRLRLIIIGVLGGGFLMLLFQALQLGDVIAWRSRGLDLQFKQTVYTEGMAFWVATLRVVQAMIAGGLFMFVALSPARALKGAFLGLLMGAIAGVVAWGGLRLINAPTLPLVLFGLLVAGVFLFLYDLVPNSRN